MIPEEGGGKLGAEREFPVRLPAPMIGSTLAHYAINSHLGSGGMGDVYEATDTKLGRSAVWVSCSFYGRRP